MNKSEQQRKQHSLPSPLKTAARLAAIVVLLALLSRATVQAQVNPLAPPPIQLRCYTLCQMGVSFGATELIVPNGVNRTIQMSVPNQPIPPYDYTEHYVKPLGLPPSLTIQWSSNYTGVWLIGFYVNYTAVVDQYISYYAFGLDSQGNQIGTTFDWKQIIGQNVKLEFQVETIQPPRPPTLEECSATCREANAEDYKSIKDEIRSLNETQTWTFVAVGGEAIAIMVLAYIVWRRR